MRVLRTTTFALALAALMASGASAQSNEATKLTYLTFSGPVQIPGATLPAGTYTFKMATPGTSAHVVQVTSRDGKKVFSSFFAIPNVRRDTPKDTIVMFKERAAGSPQAIRVWYYPGNSTGEEFIYSRRDAMAIAKVNHVAVLSSDDDTSAKSAKVTRIDENGAEAANTAPEAVVAEAQTTAPAVAATEAPVARRTSLPRTGSDLSFIALLSALSLAGAFGARRLRSHLADGV